MTTQPVHTLYRFFDSEGVLLYVGRTVDARSRFRAHERSKTWFDQVARIERQVFRSAELLAQAEISAIKTEGPLHNIQHSSRRPSVDGPRVRGGDEDRVLQRQAIMVEMWGAVPEGRCPIPEPESGCECSVCVEAVFDRLDLSRLEHADDPILVEKLDALEDEYLAGAEAIDWFYDFGDLMMFRRWRLQSHSATNPAPALASMSDGLIRVGCPFCLEIHEHYVVSGAAVGPLDSACPGSGRYLPVFDFFEATERSLEWIREVAS